VLAGAALQAPGTANASARPGPGTARASASRPPGRPDFLLPADRQRIDATSWTLSGQVGGPDRGGVTARFSVQDVTADGRWLARDAEGTGVGVQDRSSFRLTGLVSGDTYRWTMSEQAGGKTQAAAAWNTFTVDTTVAPAPVITSSGYRANGWTLASPARGVFRWADRSRDVSGWEYREDGTSWSAPVRAASLRWDPAGPGPHTLQVRAVNSAGLPGAAATYRFATYQRGAVQPDVARAVRRSGARSSAASDQTCAAGALDSPVDGTRSGGTVLLAASTSIASGDCAYVEYWYEVYGSPSILPIPTSNLVNVANGDQVSWPQEFSFSTGSYWEWSTLRWNLEATLLGAGDGLGSTPVFVQACWYPNSSGANTSNGSCGAFQEVDYNPAAFGGPGADTTVGPGTLNLTSGDFDVSSADATGASPYGSIGVGRDFTTLWPAQNSWNPNPAYTGNSGNGPSGFGPGWIADFAQSQDSPAADSVSGSVVTGSAPSSSVWLQPPDATEEYYYASSDTYPITYTGYGEAAEDGSTLVLSGASGPLTLTESDGTQIRWTLSDQSPGEFTGELSEVIQPDGEATQYFENSQGEVTTIAAPAAPGITCGSAAPATPGCRSLTISYAGTTTATGTSSGQWGSYAGNISSISYNAANPSDPASMESIAIAAYEYDSTGYLREFYDPQITSCSAAPCLATTYSYTTNSYTIDGQPTPLTQLASITPPGLNAWNLGYDADARLATVSRADPNGGTDTTTVIYNVPVTGGTGLPTTNPQSQDNSYEPGQYVSYTLEGEYASGTGTPSTATAIFPPTHSSVTDTYNSSGSPTGVTSADWPYSAVYYTDDNGYLVDTASYGDGAWQVGYTNYDTDLSGRVMNTVSPEAVDECSDPSAYPYMDPYVSGQIQDAGVACADLATDLGTSSSYTGPELTQTDGPAHQVWPGAYSLSGPGGTPVDGQLQTTYTYDQGEPSSGGPYYLATTVTTAFDAFTGATYDPMTIQYGYAAIDSGDTTGWTLRVPTTTTTDMGTTPNITKTVRYNPQGQAIESRMPSDPSGGTAGTTLTSYYTATGSGSCVNVAEAGLACQTYPAAQPTTGPALPTTTTTYNVYGQPVTVTGSNGTTTRATTTGYDAAGRELSTSIAVTPAANGGTPVPQTTQGYSQTTGLPTTITSAGGATITTGYDGDGRVVSYQDGSQPQATTTYNADGQVATINDGLGTVTYTYGGATDHRLLPSKMVDSMAGTFTASYDADGRLATETYPDGLVATRAYDDAGELVNLAYAMSGTTWLSWVEQYSTHGQLAVEDLTTANDATVEDTLNSYDLDQRLTGSTEYNYQFPAECTEVSSYSYDADSNRISQTTPQPNSGNCPTTQVTITHTYDQADRATDADSDFANDKYTYDDLGRTLTVPGSDVVDTGQNDSEVTITYYANDMVQSLEQPYSIQTYGLDPAGRILTTSTPDGNGGTSVTTNDYINGSDSPAWTSTTDQGSTSTARYVYGLDGLVDVEMAGSTAYLAINDPQGSIVAQVPYTATSLTSPAGGYLQYDGYTSFGLNDVDCYNGTCTGPQTSSLGYLGGHARTSTGLGGIILMGQRLYNPTTGRFLQPDPVPGGSANAYDYTNQDPLDSTDLTGTADSPGNCEQHPVLPANGVFTFAMDACTALNTCLHVDPMTCSGLDQMPYALQEDMMDDLAFPTNGSMYNWLLEYNGVRFTAGFTSYLARTLFPCFGFGTAGCPGAISNGCLVDIGATAAAVIVGTYGLLVLVDALTVTAVAMYLFGIAVPSSIAAFAC
jgi:RHS repeat-associated protein